MKHDIKMECNPELIDRYYDGELKPEERESVAVHLKVCPHCRTMLKDRRTVSQVFRAEVDGALSRTDFQGLDEKVLERIAQKRILGLPGLQRLFFSKPFFIPASAVAALLLVFFTFFNPTPSDPGPSAVINSFTGSVSSVMIIETSPRHTILWFSEEPAQMGEENAAHKT